MILDALKYYYGVDMAECSTRGGVITAWGVEGIPFPTDEIKELALVKYNREVIIPKEIDKEASKRILKIAPEYKQRNMLAFSIAHLEKLQLGEVITEEETSMMSHIREVWDKITAIRSYSNFLKSEVLAGNNPDINSGWSE